MTIAERQAREAYERENPWRSIAKAKPDGTVCELRINQFAGMTELPGRYFMHTNRRWYDVLSHDQAHGSVCEFRPVYAKVDPTVWDETDRKSKIQHDEDMRARAELAQLRAVARGTSTPVSFDVEIYCDGACEPNPGPGGWAYVVYRSGVEIAATSGFAPATTNNAMELTALREALRWVAANNFVRPVLIQTDSEYVSKGSNEWRHEWKKRGWKRSASRPMTVANVDLWKEVDEMLETLPVSIKWVRGHAGTRGNERADELASLAIAENTRDVRQSLIEDQLRYEVR